MHGISFANLTANVIPSYMATNKKVTRVTAGNENGVPSGMSRSFVPTPESKSKAARLRAIAVVLWILAVAAQIFAIALLFRPPVNITLVVIMIAVDLLLAIVGSVSWKKSNRFDPASEKDRLKFFIQSQLGMFTAVIAFLPLVVFVLTSKNLDKKQKTTLAGIAVGALAVAGIIGYNFNPPSVEEYTEQANRVEWLNNGRNHVYWTKAGTVYHIYDDCPYINTARTDEIFEGTVAQARELKNIDRLCSRCDHRALEEHSLNESDYVPADKSPRSE